MVSFWRIFVICACLLLYRELGFKVVFTDNHWYWLLLMSNLTSLHEWKNQTMYEFFVVLSNNIVVFCNQSSIVRFFLIVVRMFLYGLEE